MALLPISSLVLTLCFIGHSIAVIDNLYPWTPQDVSLSVQDMFGTQHSSFDINHNWEICNSHYVDVPLQPNISDYAPIITKATAMLNTTGGSVRLARGIYRVTEPIQLLSHTCIIGAGMEETFVVLTGHAPAFSDKGVIRATKGEYVSIIGLTVDGSRSMQYEDEEYGRSGVYFELINYAWCRNVRVRNHANHGFYPHGSDGRLLYHAYFEGCVAESNARDGFKFSDTAYASVFNSISQRNGRFGVSVVGGSVHSMIEGNRIFNNGVHSGCGVIITMDNARRPVETVLNRNTIINSTLSGVCLNSTDVVVVNATTISDMQNLNATCYNLTDVHRFTESGSKCETISGSKYYVAGAQEKHTSPTPTSTSTVAVTPAEPSYTTSKNQMGDFSGCVTGIAQMNVCCPLDCIVCGSDACTEEMKSSKCCPQVILVSGMECSRYNPPPCILKVERK